MSKFVVDASAILALLNQENGSENIAQLIDNAIISSVNLSEVIAKLADAGIIEDDIQKILSSLNIEVVSFNQEQGFIAGMLRPSTKPIGLSFGDRACLALGIYLGLPVLTTDRLWANLNLEIEIQVIR
jgi:PIN domain nuclease of toxin-antitoxin system